MNRGDKMLIVKIDGKNNFHTFEFQSQRDSCWIEGYIEVPESLEDILVDSNGFCDLIIENGILADIIPRPDCKPNTIITVLTREDEVDAMLIEQEYKLTLLELGVSE